MPFLPVRVASSSKPSRLRAEAGHPKQLFMVLAPRHPFVICLPTGFIRPAQGAFRFPQLMRTEHQHPGPPAEAGGKRRGQQEGKEPARPAAPTEKQMGEAEQRNKPGRAGKQPENPRKGPPCGVRRVRSREDALAKRGVAMGAHAVKGLLSRCFGGFFNRNVAILFHGGRIAPARFRRQGVFSPFAGAFKGKPS